MRIRRKAGAAFLLILFIPAVPARAEAILSAQVLPHYQTGDYASDSPADIYYVPFVFGVDTDRQALRVTIPWLNISSEEPVIFSGGDVIGRPPTEGITARTNESGLGDIVVREELFFLRPKTSKRPWVSGIARVKVPTADEQKGLGTGEVDYGAGAGLIQPLGRRWTLLAEAGYIWRGQPSGIVVRNAPWVSAGIQWAPSQGSSLYVTYDSIGSAAEGRDDIRDLSLGYDQSLSETITLRSVVYIGLSDTAEDFGVTLGVAAKKRVGARADRPGA